MAVNKQLTVTGWTSEEDIPVVNEANVMVIGSVDDPNGNYLSITVDDGSYTFFIRAEDLKSLAREIDLNLG